MVRGGAAAAGLPPSGAGEADGQGQGQHVLQVSGPLAPWTVQRLCRTLAELHTPGFSAVLDAEPCSITLNTVLPEAAAGSSRQIWALDPHRGGGALTSEEAGTWMQAPHMLGGRPIKGMQSSGGGSKLTIRV